MRKVGATISDIARAANVSISTASRALSGKGRVARATRERVRKVAQELGYRQESAPQGSIGILFPRRLSAAISESFFYGVIMVGAEETFRRWNLTTSFSTLGDPDDDLKRIGETWRHDGYLLMGGDLPQPFVRALKAKGVPLVLIDCELPDSSVDAVVIDNVGGIGQATRHLVELGHRRIGYIGGPCSHPSLAQRHAGFIAAMESAGLTVDPEMVDNSDDPSFLGARLGYEGFMKFRARGAKPTAIVCANDYVAQGVIEAAVEMGLKIPHDLSVVGFDDIKTQFGPPLTTVRVFKRQMGSLAAARLYELMQGSNVQPVRIQVSTELVKRQSTAPPPR